jgi:hypothetical protein
MRHHEIIPTGDHQIGHPNRRVAAQINSRQGHWAPRLASSDAAQVSAAGSTGSYTCRPTAARWRMPVHELAESMRPVDAQVLLGCGSDTSGAGVSRCRPGTRLDDSMCQSASAHSLEVTWAARCATLGAPGAHPRADEPYAVLGEYQHVASLAPKGHGYAAENGSVRCLTPPMPTDDTASRRRVEPLRRPHCRSM